MLLSGGIGLGLEPMSEMGGTTVHGPDPDSVSNGIGRSTVQGLTTTHLLQEGGIGGLGEGLGDLLEMEDVLTKDLRGVDGLAIGLLGVLDAAGGSVDVVLEGLDTCLVSHCEGYIFTEEDYRGEKKWEGGV